MNKVLEFIDYKNEVETLLKLRDDLIDIQQGLDAELDEIDSNADMDSPPVNHQDLQRNYPVFQLKNEISELVYRNGRVFSYLEFIGNKNE